LFPRFRSSQLVAVSKNKVLLKGYLWHRKNVMTALKAVL
jgi:hypothetical protein